MGFPSFRRGPCCQAEAILAVEVQPSQHIVGALLIQTLTTTMYARNISADIAPVPKALVIIAVCLLQSEKVRGLLARALPRKKEVHA